MKLCCFGALPFHMLTQFANENLSSQRKRQHYFGKDCEEVGITSHVYLMISIFVFVVCGACEILLTVFCFNHLYAYSPCQVLLRIQPCHSSSMGMESRPSLKQKHISSRMLVYLESGLLELFRRSFFPLLNTREHNSGFPMFSMRLCFVPDCCLSFSLAQLCKIFQKFNFFSADT